MRKKNSTHNNDIDDLRRQNTHLESQVGFIINTEKSITMIKHQYFAYYFCNITEGRETNTLILFLKSKTKNTAQTFFFKFKVS